MTVQNTLTNLEQKLSTVLGGATSVSNPSENAPDPLVQIALSMAYGVDELENKFTELSEQLSITDSDCDKLQIIGNMLGIPYQSGKSSEVYVILTGTNGFTVSGMQFTDRLGKSWTQVGSAIIKDKVALIRAKSEIGNFTLSKNELIAASLPSGVTSAVSADMAFIGYSAEDCETYRSRVINGESINNTASDLIDSLSEIGVSAFFINNAPDCISPNGNIAVVVTGGDDVNIATVLRSMSPFNYLRLAGNTTVNLGCDSIRFIRPYAVGVKFKYWGTAQVDDSEFIDALCGMTDLNIGKILQKITCIGGMEIQVIPPHTGSDTCTLPTEGQACNGSTVSILTSDCIYSEECPNVSWASCYTLHPWEYPVFISAEYQGESC